jgi:excisionase family DNA binding protein
MNKFSLELEDRLYTSTEVAKILGVSLRSVYRYLEDNKLKAEMKTATGRHRFTKQNIIDFLNPQDSSTPQETPAAAEVPAVPVAAAVVEEVAKEAEEPAKEEAPEGETPVAEEEGAEEVDWLSKFRAAAEKYKAEVKDGEADEVAAAVVEEVAKEAEEPAKKEAPAEEPAKKETPAVKEEPVEEVASAPTETVSGLTDAPEVEEEPVEESPFRYYTSKVGGLKDVAQNLDKSAKKASLDYAFTMNAGLSLHKPISPFSVIHSYVRSEDLPFFEKILDLSETDDKDAQLCLIVSDEATIYKDIVEMHGLTVVSNKQLKADLTAAGEADLANDVDA